MSPNDRARTPAAVLGLGVNGLGVVRSLGRMGIPVIGFYSHPGEAGRLSRYCTPVRVHDPDRDEGRFLGTLLDAAEGLDRPPLFPTSDRFLDFVSENRAALEGRYRLQIADAGVLRQLLDKSGTWDLARRHGMPIPPTRHPRSTDDLAAVRRELRFPCIVKPDDTFSITFPDSAKNFIALNWERLDEFFRARPDLLGKAIVQEVIQGGDGHIFVCAAYFDARSDARAVYTGRKIRQYPPDYGVTCFGESVRVPAIEEMTLRFLRSVGFRGLVAAEYARDRRTGDYYLLEINARSFYHNQLFTDCGVNLPYTAYCDALGADLPPRPLRQKEGIFWLDFQRDLSCFWRKHRRGELSWGEWVRTICAARSFAYLDPTDLMPFGLATLHFAGSLWTFLARPFRRRKPS